MTKKRETRRQQRTRELLEREVGGYWRKIWGGPFQQAGIADILGCCEGLFFALEIKEPDSDEPDGSQLQQDEIEEVIAAGGVSAVIVEPEDAVRLVRKTLRRSGKLR
jgi:hypothetical protein